MHERLFASLEKSWRTAWHNDALPFYFVQLSSLSTRPSWPAFRDSQRRLADSLSHTYMVVSSDVGDSLDVHPRRKAVIGRRLAASVLHHSYGYSQVEPCGPQPLRLHTSKWAGSGSPIMRRPWAWAKLMRTCPARHSWGCSHSHRCCGCRWNRICWAHGHC